MGEIRILPFSVENTLKRFINSKFEKDNLQDVFPNALLREDVLELLDRYCTVIYYPLPEETNNGFRIKCVPFADGTQSDFVYINTAQTMEKQVFTAAHELGHIWNVDDIIIKEMDLDDSLETRELIINRFAAVLLMPSDKFAKSVRNGLTEYGDDKSNTITYVNLLKLIVNLMNQFFVPMKSVALRLVELGIFNIDVANMILGHDAIPEAAFVELAHRYIVEFGYVKLLNPSNKKWIEGLAKKLDIAEENGLVPISKINLMRENFGLKDITSAGPEMNESISLHNQEGTDV